MPGYAFSGNGAFARTAECFTGVLGWAESADAGELRAADLEEQVEIRMREAARQLVQDRVTLTALLEERRYDVTGPEGEARPRAERDRTRRWLTKFGLVSVPRIAYKAPGMSNVHLADAVFNLPPELYSHGLRKLAAVEAARGSMQETVSAVKRSTGTDVGKRQAEELVLRAAADVEDFYAWRQLQDPPEEAGSWPLILTFDGKGIVMRAEALRPATAKAAREAENKLVTRLSPGEKPGRKRMCEVGGVYDAEPVPRTPEDVITTPAQKRREKKLQAEGRKKKPRREKRARNKWLTASVTDDIPAVVARVFDEAERRDPAHLRDWVVLVDGNSTQIEAAAAEAGKRGVSITFVIDFVHVQEYVWRACWSFFDKGEPAAEEWACDQFRKILRGKSAQVSAGIRRRATSFGYSAAERAGADECARYLTSKEAYLGYGEALAKGWPVATGIVEGACRHIVKDRMDITGARWGLSGAEAVLRLRTLIANDDFDEYWRFHLRREHERIYGVKYRDGVILAA